MTVSALLADALLNGFTFLVTCDDEVDYEGTDILEALEAIEACDEMELQLIHDDNVVGWALIINDLDDDEKIADCSGWVSRWTETHE